MSFFALFSPLFLLPFFSPNARHQDELSSFVQQVNPSMRFTADQMEAILDEVRGEAWKKIQSANRDRHDEGANELRTKKNKTLNLNLNLSPPSSSSSTRPTQTPEG